MNTRATAARVLGQILTGSGSLSSLLPDAQSSLKESERPLLQELCYGTLRWQPRLDLYLQQLLDKPLRAKDSDVQALLLLGLYQLIHMRIPDHAAISETVDASRQLKKPWASGLINGVLRRFQREGDTLTTELQGNPVFASAHPQWLIGALGKAWPDQRDAILDANNRHPPFTLRLNTRHSSRDEYLAQLSAAGIVARATPFSPYGLTLEQPCDPRTLPGFAEGLISVQDEAAQLAADLLAPTTGQRVLDACCAPGGKTGHLLERQPELILTALDSDARRLPRVEENLARLQINAPESKVKVLCGDATEPASWWDGQTFDRILLDAPCSASGIIRRQPDIKVLRTPDDIQRLAELQGCLLDSLWPLLAPGGRLVYATCSVLPRENTRVVEAFVARQPEVHCEILEADWGLPQPCGRQLLPQVDGHDGFYYAVLTKP